MKQHDRMNESEAKEFEAWILAHAANDPVIKARLRTLEKGMPRQGHERDEWVLAHAATDRRIIARLNDLEDMEIQQRRQEHELAVWLDEQIELFNAGRLEHWKVAELNQTLGEGWHLARQ